MTLLLSHLIKRTPTWKRCKLRIFVTAEENDNSEAMRETLDSYLRDMRIFAEDFWFTNYISSTSFWLNL